MILAPKFEFMEIVECHQTFDVYNNMRQSHKWSINLKLRALLICFLAFTVMWERICPAQIHLYFQSFGLHVNNLDLGISGKIIALKTMFLQKTAQPVNQSCE